MVDEWIAMSATTPWHGVHLSVGRIFFNFQFTTKVVFHRIIDLKIFLGIMHV
jgi:hypothetical protein